MFVQDSFFIPIVLKGTGKGIYIADNDLRGSLTMKKENQEEIDGFDDNKMKFNRTGKMNMTDFLIMLAGVVSVGAITVLLSWIIM